MENRLSETVDSMREKAKTLIRPKFVSGIYTPVFTEGGVLLDGTSIMLDGNDIAKLLRGCKKCILMAATIGTDIDREIKLREYSDLTGSLILDSCATVSIEEVCDVIQNNIEKEFKSKGLCITQRYSPGYGDLPLIKNRDILNALEAQKKAGITINANGIMIPRKSVVAIIGIYDSKDVKKNSSAKKSCRECSNYSACVYRRESEGFVCGNQRILEKG